MQAPEYAIATSDERVALELHVGDRYERNHTSFATKDGFVMRRGDCVRIQTHEEVQTPRDVFGFVCAKAGLAGDGLLVAMTKVDPFYAGHLHLVAYNGGPKPIHLASGDAFCCLSFSAISPLEEEMRRSWTPTGGVAFTNKREKLKALLREPYAPFVAALFTGLVIFVSEHHW
jgi:deoxycytidine triphosphate deaminase